MRIKITPNGPYFVTGAIPIKEMIITQEKHHMALKEGRPLPQADEYALCRCGGSHNAPFCDGAHATNGFHGTETASRAPYRARINDVISGHTMNLLDDGRCAFARFCHTERGDIWSISEQDSSTLNRAAAIRAAADCPAGRLVMTDKEGNILEMESDPEILIVQDPQKNCSAGIFVKGPIVIEGADGEEYEVRNRVALCRCGRSGNKPFCDASHVNAVFKDGFLDDSR